MLFLLALFDQALAAADVDALHGCSLESATDPRAADMR
jgi:hypothetical protein